MHLPETLGVRIFSIVVGWDGKGGRAPTPRRFVIGVLFCLHLTSGAFAADVLSTTYSPDDGRGRPRTESKTEVVQVLFNPGEEAVAEKFLKEAVNGALTSNPSANATILCASGGALTSLDCGKLKRDLADHEKAPGFSFEETKTGEPPGAEAKPAEKKRSDWKGVLTFIRTISAGVTVGVTAVLSKGANWPQALIAGGTAGAWSGLMQWRNRDRLNWQSHGAWLSTAPPEEHERAGTIKRYLKRAIQTGIYGALMTGAFYLTHLNHDLISPTAGFRLLTMVGESLYTQTAWEALNQQWTEAAIKRNPERAHIYKRLSGIASLVQATINVVANALNIGGVHVDGVHVGTVISGVVGTAGTLAYAVRWVPEGFRKGVGSLLRSCASVFGLFGKATSAK